MRWRTFPRAELPGLSTLLEDSPSVRLSAAAPWLVAALSLSLFVATLSRDLTWRYYSVDGGELITAAMTLGVAHPPGYPLYILIGRLFGLLPLGTVAGRFAFLSALAAAAAIALAVRSMTFDRRSNGATFLLVTAVGLALALTPLVWGQAVVAEVYAFALFFVSLFIWAVLSGRSSLVVGLTLGLAVTAHLTGLLLLPLALWKTGRSGLFRFLIGAAAGLAPFLLLPVLAAGSSPLVWGQPQSLGSWWWLVSAQLYRPNVFGLPPSQWLARLVDWTNPTILAPLLLWLGLASLVVWRSRREADRRPLALTATAALVAVYAFTYRPEDAPVLLLPAMLLLAIVVGRGLAAGHHRWAWLLAMLMLGLALFASHAENDDRLRASALARLAQLPPQAIVLTPGDATVSALWYLHYVEGVRPDIVVVDQNMFQFDWYRDRLRSQYPALFVPSADDLAEFMVQNRLSRPVCWLSLVDNHRGPEGCLSMPEVSID